MKQLTGPDAMFLHMELKGFPMQIGGVSIYDQSTSPGGLVRFKDILAMFESRLDRSPIFRRKLAEVPFNLDQPYWVDDPDFELTSVPSLPGDEVLARFLFGKGIDDLSPLQAVQLANAVATLTGRGGIGVLGNLREGLGLDDLDLSTNAEGDTEVRAGRYISDNIYTEFVADSDGGTEIDVNIDVSRNFTVKGTTTSSGDSAIGLFWERDY